MNTDAVLTLTVIYYATVGIFGSMFVNDDVRMMNRSTRRAAHLASALWFIFCPLAIPALVPAGLYYGGRWLVRAFRELYRTFVPKKVKLPEARIV